MYVFNFLNRYNKHKSFDICFLVYYVVFSYISMHEIYIYICPGGPKQTPGFPNSPGVPNKFHESLIVLGSQISLGPPKGPGGTRIVIWVPNSYGGPRKLQFAAYEQFVLVHI